ncbi:uncharacterized protein LOC130454037 isoform X2 [Monodelphis domestica]|uniref:uncharacterized protein LOC130454037 isoform X2 n=1 Tax=Monodelphis domestica TaxID=13616 RepID=UPI0024E25B68|nr:uncharacterized protein LOC130454037 isoform X2 [Monodelphis domestica]
MGIMNSCLPDGQVRSWGSGSRRPGPGPQGLLPDSRVPCSEEAFIPNPGDPPGRLAPGPSLRPGSEVSTLSLSRRRPCPFHRGLGGADWEMRPESQTALQSWMVPGAGIA